LEACPHQLLQSGENGSVTADCSDWWGQASNESTAFVWS